MCAYKDMHTDLIYNMHVVKSALSLYLYLYLLLRQQIYL